MKAKNRINSIILAVPMLILAALSCNFEVRETTVITYEKYFSMNPISLITTISQNENKSLVPVEDRPELPPPDQQIPVTWKQSDYLIITNALFTQIWGETTEGWSLKSMFFGLGCDKTDQGFQHASFQLFRNESTQGYEVRIGRDIYIDARSKFIFVTERVYFPRYSEWGSVNLKQLLFTADNALNIAEASGGKNTRSAAQDQCDITLLLVSDSPGYRGWTVRYGNSANAHLFEIWVDPATGETELP